MLLNIGAEDSCEFLGEQGYQTSQSLKKKSALNINCKD